MKRLLLVGFGLGLVACDAGEHRAARDKYNEGVALLAKGELDNAEKALLDARSQAGVDPELRFRAAYDLGSAYAADAEKVRTGKEPDLAKALELEQQAVSWFADAQRLETTDKDTATNLAITRARVQAISDELRKGEGKLEKRLDVVIGEQGTVLDGARAAWLAIKQAGGADPLAQQGALTHLADLERGIVAEAGVIGDLAGDEIDAIGKKPEDKRSDEEKVRVVQLRNLDTYLGDARTKIAEARRKLQDLAAEEAVRKAEGALVSLKRAREQLLDPITVLRSLAAEEAQLMQETATLAKASSLTESAEAGGPVPAWLDGKAQGERQGGVRDRLEEVHARFAAGVSNMEQQTQPKEVNGQSVAGKAVDPKQAKVMERVKAALPSVIEASGAMDHARGALTDKKLAKAADDERTALLALAKAIEEFADLKQTIDLTWEDQERVVRLLGPEGAAIADRARDTGDGVRRNLARIDRIKALLADEVAALEHGDQKPPQDPKQAEAQKQQLEQEKQKLAYAETLRGEAAGELAKLEKALGDAKADPMAPAKAADAKLTDLRKLFFSVIEHLEQLIRDQSETHDQTAAANADDDFARAPKLPGLIGREDEHGKMAKAITDALAAQADAAAKQGPEAQQQGPSPKALAGAAEEVRLGHNDMSDAQASLTKAKDGKQSMTLDPAAKSEAKAVEHLTSALKLLQPPPQKKQDDQKQDDKKDDQKKDDQKKQDQQQQQQGGPGQRARDDDARRQKERQQQQHSPEPVDQDW